MSLASDVPVASSLVERFWTVTAMYGVACRLRGKTSWLVWRGEIISAIVAEEIGLEVFHHGKAD